MYNRIIHLNITMHLKHVVFRCKRFMIIINILYVFHILYKLRYNLS
nr:MAG TPA: hypothetical protein [Caudoviricetes sp.]